MPAHLADHSKIISTKTVSGNSPKTSSFHENAGETFVAGTPLQLVAGIAQAWDGATIAAGIIGIAMQDASNLATDGAGSPAAYGGVGAPGSQVTFGKVPYQPSAVNIPGGAPMTDGRVVTEHANPDTVFEAQFDHAAYAVAADATPTLASIGAQYGLTKDATGHWYVDGNKTTPGANTVLLVTELNPVDGLLLNGRVRFKFLDTAAQFVL